MKGLAAFLKTYIRRCRGSLVFLVTNPASSACNMSCRRLEEDKPLSVPSSRVTGSLHSRRSAPGSLVCIMLHCSRQQRFDSSFQMVAGPDVNPGLQKVLPERLLLCLCCRSCLLACLGYLWGEIKRAKPSNSQKSPFFLAFLEIKGISPNILPLSIYKRHNLMCTLKICTKLAPSLKEEPY